jgi:hypothetical protein
LQIDDARQLLSFIVDRRRYHLYSPHKTKPQRGCAKPPSLMARLTTIVQYLFEHSMFVARKKIRTPTHRSFFTVLEIGDDTNKVDINNEPTMPEELITLINNCHNEQCYVSVVDRPRPVLDPSAWQRWRKDLLGSVHLLLVERQLKMPMDVKGMYIVVVVAVSSCCCCCVFVC